SSDPTRRRRTCPRASRSPACASTTADGSTSRRCSTTSPPAASGPCSSGAGLVDEVVGYVRAAVLGAGRPLLDIPGVTTIGDLRAFRLLDAEVVGDDV